jgi:hypothetical protein
MEHEEMRAALKRAGTEIERFGLVLPARARGALVELVRVVEALVDEVEQMTEKKGSGK